MQAHTVTDYLLTLDTLLRQTIVTNISGEILSLEEGSNHAIEMINEIAFSSKKVMLGGNGGSSAIVSHVQNDLSEPAGVRSMIFTEEAVLTARANDYGYGSVFERPIELWAEPEDLVVTVSSSGQSENIIRALRIARKKKCKLITFSGFKPDNPSRYLGDINFYVDSNVYGYVEIAHMSLVHYLTGRVTQTILARKSGA